MEWVASWPKLWHTVFISVSMVAELASLTPAQLMEKIRALQNMAYQLGVEEGERRERMWERVGGDGRQGK